VTKLAIVQSNYIPWIGYFQLINSVDIFVLFDNVQYTNRDWRNRNKIKTPQGAVWLTIPIKGTSNRLQLISETEVQGLGWVASHLETIRRNYSRSAYFDEIFPKLERMYNSFEAFTNLSLINEFSLKFLCKMLEIKTRIIAARDKFPEHYDANQKLISICQNCEANIYVSGPKAKSYIDEKLFEESGIKIEYIEYRLQNYTQLWGDFEPNLSLIDSLFNAGLLQTQEMIK
jgi:WbqC-like protein family